MSDSVSIDENVRKVISEITGNALDKVVPSAHLESDLLFDDLDRVEVTMELEDVFDINIPDGEAEWKTVQEIIDYMNKRKAA